MLRRAKVLSNYKNKISRHVGHLNLLRSRSSTSVQNGRQTNNYHDGQIGSSAPVENDDDFVKQVKVGITEFLQGRPIITAAIKERHSDFHVHEIDLNGTKIQLTDLNPPETTTTATQNDDGCDVKAKGRTEKRERKKTLHTHCTLYKEGLAGSQVVHFLSKEFKIHPNTIRWAGTKDKKGKTTQRISIANVDAHRLVQFSNLNRNIKLGNFTYSSAAIGLGELKGNHFKMLLKNIKLLNPSTSSYMMPATAAGLAFEERMESLKEIGFINYFGVQRFGNYGVRPYTIGNAIIQMNWEKVFDLILSPKPNDSDEMVRAKALWFTLRDPVEIAKVMQRLSPQNYHRSLEAHLFKGLARHYKDGVGYLNAAYKTIPETHRLIYVPSFTSLLWNHVASFRLRKFGLTPVPGDLVRVESSYAAPEDNDKLNEEQEEEPVSSNPCSFDDGSCGDLELDEDYQCIANSVSSSTNLQVKVLTDEDLVHGHPWSINDIFLPVPGKQGSRYANPIVQNFFEEILQEYGLSADCFEKFKPKSDLPQGSYRPLIVKPDDLKYTIIPYGEADVHNFDTLIPSDWDLLQEKIKMGDSVGGGVEISDQNYLSRMREKKKYGRGRSRAAAGFPRDKICAVLEFTLNTSSYATMALREVLQ